MVEKLYQSADECLMQYNGNRMVTDDTMVTEW